MKIGYRNEGLARERRMMIRRRKSRKKRKKNSRLVVDIPFMF